MKTAGSCVCRIKNIIVRFTLCENNQHEDDSVNSLVGQSCYKI